MVGGLLKAAPVSEGCAAALVRDGRDLSLASFLSGSKGTLGMEPMGRDSSCTHDDDGEDGCDGAQLEAADDALDGALVDTAESRAKHWSPAFFA